MRKLALPEDVLLAVEKPARYIGNEWNSVMKDKDKVAIRFAMCFPDVYEVGMSPLGMQILCDMFNRMEDVWCERVFSPWFDLDRIMRERTIPMFALESQDPVSEFDFLGFSMSYEMCYTNVLQVLDLSGLALRSCDRKEDDPIVVGGGVCTYNPEPVADFFDLFYIGEGETQFPRLIEIYREKQRHGHDKKWFLEQAATVPGIYVPAFYDVSYDEEGRLTRFEPNNVHAKEKIRREVVEDFDQVPYPTKPVVPFAKAIQDRIVLEIMRGCIRGCRFCQAGMTYRPCRQKSLSTLKEYALEMLENTGYDEISLSSLSTSDYDELKELVDFLFDLSEKERLSISLPSLRIDSFALETMKRVGDLHKSSLTFAPEAGSQRLRDVINKGLTIENILDGSYKAFVLGWNKVKLYFMLGHPFETEEDIRDIPRLADQIARTYYEIPKDQRNGKCQITISTSFFVPKPFTPFQWCGVPSAQTFLDKAHMVMDELMLQHNKKSIKYQWHSAETTLIEAVFARGDRRLSDVIQTAYEKGAIYDAWTDGFDFARWEESFAANDLSMDFYLREMELDELLPWDHIDIGVTKKFLLREWEQAKQAKVTPNCKEHCSGCGATIYGGGVCHAHAS